MSIKALPSRAERPARGSAPSRGSAPVTALRVDLLPPEIGERNKQKSVRRGLKYVVMGVAVLVLLGVAGTWVLATGAQSSLAAEQANTQTLIAQQAKYADVRAAQNAIILGEAGERVGGSTEINWLGYLAKIQASLPSGVVINSVLIHSSTPVANIGAATIPLQGARVAELTFTALSPTLPHVPDWLDRMRALPGFVDAEPGTVTLGGGGYTATITLHVDSGAYSGRFSEDGQTARDKAFLAKLLGSPANGSTNGSTTDGTATDGSTDGTTSGASLGTPTTTGDGK